MVVVEMKVKIAREMGPVESVGGEISSQTTEDQWK